MNKILSLHDYFLSVTHLELFISLSFYFLTSLLLPISFFSNLLSSLDRFLVYFNYHIHFLFSFQPPSPPPYAVLITIPFNLDHFHSYLHSQYSSDFLLSLPYQQTIHSPIASITSVSPSSSSLIYFFSLQPIPFQFLHHSSLSPFFHSICPFSSQFPSPSYSPPPSNYPRSFSPPLSPFMPSFQPYPSRLPLPSYFLLFHHTIRLSPPHFRQQHTSHQ